MAAIACSVALAGCALRVATPPFPIALPDATADGTAAIAVIGDLQLTPAWIRSFRRREDNEPAQGRLVADLESRIDDIAVLAIVGDLVFTPSSRRDWAHFDSLIAPIADRLPVLPAIGNHDYHCLMVELCFHARVPRRFRARFPWIEPGTPYEVVHGDVVLYFLDSETDLEAQGAWLAERLADGAGTFAAAFVLFHRPPFSNSIDLGARGDEAAVESIVPVVTGSPLPTIVINGHIHGYERLLVDGITYVTTAGGGGPRGLLGAERPRDAYSGPDCVTNDDGSVLRPLNYVLIRRDGGGIDVEVRGLCRADEAVSVLESFRVPVPEN